MIPPEEWVASDPPPELWDEQFAQELVGLRVLVGLTYLEANGELIEKFQFFGIVRSADRKIGITLKLEGQREGEEYVLPPDTRGLQRGVIGEYRLRSTSEIVTDPDYVCSFNIQKPLC